MIRLKKGILIYEIDNNCPRITKENAKINEKSKFGT